MGYRRYRKANPALSVTKLTCAMATWLFCQLQQPCAVGEVLCNTLGLHRCRVALVKWSEMVPARAQANKPRQGCVRYSTRGNGSYGYKINDNGRSALTTSLLLAAIEMEPALVQCNHLCTRTVRWNGGLRQLPKGPLCSRIYLICGPPTANYRSSRATARAITESMSSTAGKLLDLAKTRADWTTRQRHKTLVSESGPWANMGQVAMATLASIAVLAT